jgi:hypothetical protein
MKKLAWMAAAALLCGLSAAPAHAQRQDRSRIRAEEIAQSNATTVYQLIQSKRGMWLMRSHNSADMTGTGAGGLLVFYDGAQLDGVEDLRDVPTAGVRLVEFLTPHDAEQKLGKYTTVGAIVVLTHDETPPADSAHAAAHPR